MELGAARSTSGPHERIFHFDFRESTEVTVCGPQFDDAVLNADRRDARIVDTRPGNTARRENSIQGAPMFFSFSQSDDSWRFKPGADLIISLG